MAIQLEFINFIVPVRVIKQKYSGGWDTFLHDYTKNLGRLTWYDDQLVRSGGSMMNSEMIDIWLEKWTKLGFQSTQVIDGKTVWNELCVCDAFGFSKHDCPWIIIDGAERVAWLRGYGKGDVMGREQFRR